VVLREPLKETPNDLINKIKALEEGEKTIPLIKGLKPLGKRLLLVYLKDLDARETLLASQRWISVIQADLYTREYYIVAHGIDSSLEES